MFDFIYQVLKFLRSRLFLSSGQSKVILQDLCPVSTTHYMRKTDNPKHKLVSLVKPTAQEGPYNAYLGRSP